MAVNLARHGVISLEGCGKACYASGILSVPHKAGTYLPTNFREPVPILVSALGVRIVDSALGPSDAEAYFEGPRAKYLKYQNIVWAGLLSVCVFWAVRALTGSFWLALASVVLINFRSLPRRFDPVDDLLTEISAMAILFAASISLALAFIRQRLSLFLAAGLLFGILTLIKAVTLYVFLGVLVILICLYLLRRPAIPRRNAVQQIGVLAAAFVCVLAPWLYRNYVQLGTLQVTQRGGVGLWERALEDQISAEEYRGVWYLWAPPGRLQNWLGKRWQFSADDVRRGGRLQRLGPDHSSALSRADRDGPVMRGRPDEAIMLFWQAWAERMRLQRDLAAAGHVRPDVDAERALYARAAALIAAHPWRHLALTPAFMWRGAAKAFPVLTLALVLGFWWKRYDLVLFVLPAFGMVLTYALFTPFIPRYGSPPRAIALVALVIMLKLTWDAIRARTAERQVVTS